MKDNSSQVLLAILKELQAIKDVLTDIKKQLVVNNKKETK